MDRTLAILFAAIGAAGTIFGIVDPTDILFPKPVGMLDTSVEGFDHANLPNRLAFSLQHNGTGSFFIHDITFKTKNFEEIPCSDDAPTDVWPAGMFPILTIYPTDSDHFTQVRLLSNPMKYDNGQQLVFDYFIVSLDNIELQESYEFWVNYTVGYSEDGESENMRSATYHAHIVENRKLC